MEQQEEEAVTVHRSSVTSVSWIPSEAIPNTLVKLPILLGIAHYDPPPPDRLEDLEALHAAGAFRFANRLSAWIEIDRDGIAGAGYDGGGLISSTIADLKVTSFAFPPVAYADLRQEPEYGDGWVRFVQTTGGRTGAPLPRRINRPPFVQVTAPTVWTTLSLTLHDDGRSDYEVVGASPFPRHWFYDHQGTLVKKSGIADYRSWSEGMDEGNSPWGERENVVLIADAESDLERAMSATIMRGGAKPRFQSLEAGETLTEQGAEGSELFLVLDGMLTVEVDSAPVAEIGPGSIVGERAVLEGGRRTSTVRALTRVRVAVADAGQIDADALEELARGHRREEEAAAGTPE